MKDNIVVRMFLFLGVLLMISIVYRIGITHYTKIKERGYLIEFQDHELEKEIRRNMNQYGEFWSGYAKREHTMEIIGGDIISLEDLRHFPNLQRLYLRETSITDLSPLESMKDLSLLIIDGGKVKDLEPLSKVKTLVRIDLKNLPVTTIGPLSELENLGILSLSGLDLKEIPSWKGDSLSWLELRNLPLTTIEGFRNEENIAYIDIRNTNIEDVSTLSSMPGLIRITIMDSPIRNMPDLERFSRLDSIYIQNTNLRKMPTLPDDLMELRLRGNLIYDFIFTKPMNTLYTLEISDIPEGCTLEGLKFLEMCPEVSRLTLSNDRLQSLDGIEVLSGLSRLYLSGNKLDDVNEIEIHSGLKALDVSNNPVNDLSGMEQLKQLEELNVSGININSPQTQEILSSLCLKTLNASSSNINNLDFLKNSLEMRDLNISNNRLQDIGVLAELKGLYNLDISYNPITDLTPLIELPIYILDISGINFKTINTKLWEDVLKRKFFNTLTASKCNLENLDFFNQAVEELNVSDNSIQDLSILNKGPGRLVQLDVSGNLLTEEDVKKQLDVTEIYPGIYLGPNGYADRAYYQIKIKKESEFLEDIGHYKP